MAPVEKMEESALTSVLYVEDDEQMVEVVAEAFREEFELVAVSNSEDGLKLIQKRSFDVIISDYRMSQINGIEFLKLLRAGPLKTTPFILFTGKAGEEIINEVADREYFYYVSKGVGALDELVYVAKDAAVRKKAADFPIAAFKKLQLLNATILHDWKNNEFAESAYVSLIEEETNIDSIRAMCKKIATLHLKNFKLREESKILHQVGVDNDWLSLNSAISKMKENIDIVFVNEIPEDIEIFVNPLSFSIVGNILVDNSQRHGQRVSKINVSFIKNDKDIRFCYRDNGVGVVPENKKYIFDRGVGKNSGWGLYLAKEILNLFDGDIVETGTFGEGACFEIIIPFCLYRHALKKQ